MAETETFWLFSEDEYVLRLVVEGVHFATIKRSSHGEEGRNRTAASTQTGMSEIVFAQRCARIAALCSKWASDILDTQNDDPREPANREPVERFIREVRERLIFMEEDLG